ncbi:response regulator transcription factor [Chishuiella sp.]|uniref:response regulator transcription factor n=1 Tax=Chishuiella sp. TaxID=1969467 RepID=UPI0028A76051|nr:response regulator transcription factor [Chishuiella sp.]
MKNKLILIEDDQDLGLVLQQYLEYSNYEVIWFNHPQKFLDNLHQLQNTKLLIVDVMMPEIDGFTLVNQLKDKLSIPYLFLTAKAQSFDRVLGLKIGADDYITKPCDPEELLLRIKNILKRNYTFPQVKIAIGDYLFNHSHFSLKHKEKLFQLTEKEAELLSYFIQHNNQLVYRKEILETIWGENDYFLGRSLDVFMTRLRKYFKEDERIKFESVRGIGFKIELPINQEK